MQKTACRVRVDLNLDVASFLKNCEGPDLPEMTSEEKRDLVEEQTRQVLEHAPWREYFGVNFHRGDYEVIEVDLVEQPSQAPEVIGCPGR